MSQEQLENSNNFQVERFRILVIGNANAGKTTILEKVCHAQGREPVCLNNDSKLEPSASRGNHEIEHQFQYPTAHGFVFHDSCGFEAGGAVELQKVRNFIESRAKGAQLKDQLHAIWYCLPTSNDRGMTDKEMSLFERGTGNVPIIAIFTKMDALDQEARNQLMFNDDDLSREEIEKKVPDLAEEIFQKKYLKRLNEVKHKPRYVVYLRDMNKEGTNCDELIVRTSQALDRDTLKLFCLSILRINIESRIKQVINK
ncbi:GTP-binding protein [Hysterangium stoloniferum]|nr:GTP-binding protein [Hysterangium stoloniferum]